MFPMWIFTAFGAFFLASVAAYFSIVGLGALYAAAFIAIVIMGTAVEYGKIAATFWLHRNYKQAPKWLVSMLIVVVISSMAITSGGVYGFLTKGHIDQETPLIDTNLRIERLDNRISTEKKSIDREDKSLDQLDQVIQTLIDYDKISGKTGARAVRNGQNKERSEILKSIDNSYKRIDDFRDKKLILKQKVTGVEAKLGPVKFLAALFNLDTDSTIRYFTLLVVLLLDPFAIMLVLATAVSYDRWRLRKGMKSGEPVIIEKEIIVEKEVLVEVEKIVEKIVEVPVEVEKIVEKEVIIERDAPLTMESVKEFLESPEIQEELVKHPELIQEVEKLIDEINKKRKITDKPSSAGWLDGDSKKF